MQFDRNIEGGHCHKLEQGLGDGCVVRDEAIKVGEGNAHYLTIEVAE
jgi:hypothetical protein